MTRIVLYDMHGVARLRSFEAFISLFELEAAGHQVFRTESSAWINFEIEEEAALFKLMHL